MTRSAVTRATPAQLQLLCEAGIAHANAGAFHAAHAAFESAWLATPTGPLQEGLRGLVQLVVAAHHHVAKGATAAGRRAAATVLERACARLARADARAALCQGPAPVVAGVPLFPTDAAAALLVLDAWAHDPEERRTTLVAAPSPGLAAAAILLAGGHGRRAGGPKALKRIDGSLLWRVQAHALGAVGCAPVVAVLHPEAWTLADAPMDVESPLALPADPNALPFASLLQALAALPPGHAAFVLPVDCPCPTRATFCVLRAAALDRDLRGQPWDAVRPLHDGRGGHPVLLAPMFARVLATLDPTTARLDVELATARAAGLLVEVAVQDAGVRANFNRDGVSV